MICRATNKLVDISYWIMSYGCEKKSIVPDTEVSIEDFMVALMVCISLVSLIAWWWIPCTWVYDNILWKDNSIWNKINNVLRKKRFKCKGK